MHINDTSQYDIHVTLSRWKDVSNAQQLAMQRATPSYQCTYIYTYLAGMSTCECLDIPESPGNQG